MLRLRLCRKRRTPIYEYHCRECGRQFEKLARSFDPGEVGCTFCHSLNVGRLLSSPLIRMGKGSEVIDGIRFHPGQNL
ncbi:MAG: zinc ribbon domain-containing protein [Dehalococcoidales bacterium]